MENIFKPLIMCEFCKFGERNSIIDNDPTITSNSDVIIREKPEFWIQEAREEFKPDNPILMSYLRLGIKNDNTIIYSGMTINYCPICGRKLEKYE